MNVSFSAMSIGIQMRQIGRFKIIKLLLLVLLMQY